MPIIASAGGSGRTWTPHPEGGFPAVAVDVYDEGYVEESYQGGPPKMVHKIRIYFFCGEWEERDGQRYPLLVNRRFTLSLAESSNLRPFLEMWRGKKFTTDELHGFDVEKLIGAPAYIQVSHNTKGDRTYANVDAALRLQPNMGTAPMIPEDFKRRHVREAEKAAENGQPAREPGEDDEPVPTYGDDDVDLPF